MKFLVIATRRQQVPAPPEALPAILMAQREYIDERLDDGRFDVIFMSSPAFWLNDWDIRPLADIDTVLGNAAAGLARAAAGARA